MWLNLCKLIKVSTKIPSNKITTSSTFYRSINSYVFKMDKAYLRHQDNADQFQITFKYENPDQKVSRQFNFSRQISETVATFLARVTANVEKVIGKKNRKKRKKNEDETKAGETSDNTNETNTELSIQSCLLLNDKQVNGETTCSEIFREGNKVILKLNNVSYEVIFNSPWVETLTLPNSMLAGFPVYPLKLDTLFTDRSLSEFLWYKSEDKTNWVQVGSGFTYVPSNGEINSHLKLSVLPRSKPFRSQNLEDSTSRDQNLEEPVNEFVEGPIIEVVSENKVEASPGFCPFENRHQFTKEKLSGKEFRVITYNILADLYCDSDYTRTVLFPYCPPYALSIDYRKQLFLKELIGYQGDIICLQEVDKKVYTYDLDPVLSNLGYESYFSLKGGLVAEGVACFYHQNRFKMLDSMRVELSKHLETEPALADIWKVVSQNDKLKERVLERSSVLQTVLLQSKDDDKELLLVGNTHLYFHPDADHIRLLQGGMCIKLMDNLVKRYKEKYGDKQLNILFCGDLNSSPDSGIYKLFTSGLVPEDSPDWTSNVEEAVKGLSLSQPYSLASACGIPQYTNYTDGFKDCLDWIYYETKGLKVVQVVPLPSNEELSEHVAIPSVVFPSDHVALIADLKWV